MRLCISLRDFEAIHAAPMFSSLPPDALDVLLAHSELQAHARHTVLSSRTTRRRPSI
jgi:hypothetical protein